MSLEGLSPESRVWMFLAERELAQSETGALSQALDAFVNDWKAHGAALTAGYAIESNAIVIVAVDESQTPPSGCSIDKVFRLLQEFGSANGIDFFKRTLTARKNANRVEILNLVELKQAYLCGDLQAEDLVYNTQIDKLSMVHSQLLIPFSQHWMGKKWIEEHMQHEG